MELNVEYLVKRGDRYYFRWRIPKEFSESVPVKEIKCSLKTKKLAKAEITCRILTGSLKKYFRREGKMKLSIDRIRAILADKVNEALEFSERHIATFGPICEASRLEGIEFCDRVIRMSRDALRTNDLNFLSAYDSATNYLKDFPHDDEDIALTAREFLKTQIYTHQIKKQRFEGNYDNEFDAVNYKEILSGRYWVPPRENVVISSAPASAPEPPPEDVFTLSQLIERYVNEKVSSGAWQRSMEYSVKKILDIFLEVQGDVDIRSIRHKDVLSFRDDILINLPRSVGNRDKYKNLTIKQIASLNILGSFKQSPKTINIKMEKIASFFKWCLNHEFIDRNPATNMSLKLGHRAHEERLPYSKEELVKIFTKLRPENLNAWAPHKMWVALISLHSGARQSEICQLYLNDIKVFENIPCFILQTDLEDKSIKTPAGQRTVPIHPTLLQLGFLEYVIDLKKKNVERLWPELKKGADGYGQKYQRFFGRFNRNFITEDKLKVFHSLRHNFTNNLKQRGVEESKIAEIVGHAVNSMTFGRYGKPFIPSVLLKAMNKLDHGIDLFDVLDKTPLSDEQIAEQIKQLPVAE